MRCSVTSYLQTLMNTTGLSGQFIPEYDFSTQLYIIICLLPLSPCPSGVSNSKKPNFSPPLPYSPFLLIFLFPIWLQCLLQVFQLENSRVFYYHQTSKSSSLTRFNIVCLQGHIYTPLTEYTLTYLLSCFYYTPQFLSDCYYYFLDYNNLLAVGLPSAFPSLLAVESLRMAFL